MVDVEFRPPDEPALAARIVVIREPTGRPTGDQTADPSRKKRRLAGELA
jgi:hypothetical protein